jgi:hypothetical protein
MPPKRRGLCVADGGPTSTERDLIAVLHRLCYGFEDRDEKKIMRLRRDPHVVVVTSRSGCSSEGGA